MNQINTRAMVYANVGFVKHIIDTRPCNMSHIIDDIMQCHCKLYGFIICRVAAAWFVLWIDPAMLTGVVVVSLQALMVQDFQAGDEWLPGVHDHWAIGPLSYLIDLEQEGSGGGMLIM